MDNIDALKSLSDDELLRRLSDVLARSRRVEWVLVAHIAEVDARRLFAREGSPSMYQYCLDVLHLSEPEAYRRIAAARLSRSYPVLLKMLEDGRIHLAGISVLRKHLTDANYEDVLARATHKTKRDIEILVAELAPKPDVPPTIRKRPQRRAKAEPPKLSTQLCPDAVEQAAPAAAAKPATPAKIEPLAPARYIVLWRALHKTIYGERLFMGSPLTGRVFLATPSRDFAPYKDLPVSKAMSLSGGWKRPLRSCGGTTAWIASSLSVGSARV